MEDSEIHKKYYSLRNNNYLVNSYKHIIKSNIIHFIVTLIEILLNIFQELYIFIDGVNFDSELKNEFADFILLLKNKISSLSSPIKLFIIFVYTIIFDSILIFLTIKKFNKKYKSISYLFNIMEFLHFRILLLIFLNIFFSFENFYIFLLCILFIPHFYLISSHFFYNHLYYFVPIYIEYPYDEFSSLYDLISLFIKFLLSIIINTNNITVKNFCHIILFLAQIFFCCLLINKLVNHSYLFMKNNFLNKVKVSLFFVQAFCLIIAESISKNEIISLFYLIISVGILIFLLLFVNFFYEPKSYIKIENDTPMENMFFYLFIISEKNEINFLLESKINEHYENCGICSLCYKYQKYLDKFEEIKDNEQVLLINDGKMKEENNLINLFEVLYTEKNNYFLLVNQIALNYKYNKKKYLINSSYYYINLSFLMYSEFNVQNIILSLNIKLLLEVINKDNIFIENKNFEIRQIIFCNEFLSLSNNIISKIKEILSQNYTPAKKLIDLSSLLKEMKNPKYKDILYNYKQDNPSSSKNTIAICSILYEEIFNVTLNSSQVAIRDNIQILEDIFFNNNNKADKIITLAINLTNNNCKIIRAGKDLYKYKDNNLFDLFPLIFRDHQIKLFLSKIFDTNNIRNKKHKESSVIIKTMENKTEFKFQIRRRETRLKILDNKKTKKKNENIEIKLIICESISSKLFYKLLILSLSPLFNCDFNSYYLLFDGNYFLYKNSIMTLQDFETNKVQKVIAVSKPQLEKPPQIYSMIYPKYCFWLEKNGFFLTKIFQHNISNKKYTIYSISPKEKESNKKIERKSFYQRESIFDNELSDTHKNLFFNNQLGKLIDENSSVVSQQISNNYTFGLTGYGIKSKKKGNIYKKSKLFIINNVILLSIPFVIIIYCLEIYHLNKLKDENINNDYSILKFDEIYKLYFELFSSTLCMACIKRKNDCKSPASFFIVADEELKNFNLSSFLSAQNKLLLHNLLLKKNNLITIHKNIGNEKYKEIFEEKVDYIRISKTFINSKLTLSLSSITIPFSEAILKICNSFQIIVNHTKNDPIYILNKRTDPLNYLSEEEIQNFNDYQKEISELILNYKIYKNQFININQKFIDTLAYQSQNIELYLYLYINLTMVICIYFLCLLYIYMLQFEQIIIKILNYVNMIKNYQKGNINFSSLFLKKIENLEKILHIYTDNPFKAVQNLNSLYKKYHKNEIEQNKINANNANKKSFKKINQRENKKDELDMVPENQRIYNKNDIKKLYILYYYFLLFFLIFLAVVIVSIRILFIWVNYSNAKTNLYSLINKNLELEISLYKTINLYDLVIFNNLTIDELSRDVFYDLNNNIYDGATLINSFYKDLHIAFNYEIEISVLRKAFKNFPFFNFTCENLYFSNKENILELGKYSSSININDIGNQLIRLCELLRVAEFNDMNSEFQWHYQHIKNSIISITNYSYEGLIAHINTGKLAYIQSNFNGVLIYILDIVTSRMHQEEIDDIIIIMKEYLSITLIVTAIMYIVLIIIIRFFYIRRLKKYFNQVLLLKHIFKIYEMPDQ